MSAEPEFVEREEQTVAVIAGRVPMSELPDFFDRSFGELAAVLTDQGVGIVGPAFARYHGPPEAAADLEVGFPTDRPVTATGSVRPGALPAGRTARLVHEGPYDSLGESWQRLGSWIAGEGEQPADAMWEVYVTEPTPDTDPATLRTELWWSLRASSD